MPHLTTRKATLYTERYSLLAMVLGPRSSVLATRNGTRNATRRKAVWLYAYWRGVVYSVLGTRYSQGYSQDSSQRYTQRYSQRFSQDLALLATRNGTRYSQRSSLLLALLATRIATRAATRNY